MVGSVVRVYLPEDLACVVEDFLFSRKSGIYSQQPTFMRVLLVDSVREDDFDALLFTFCMYLNHAPCPHLATERGAFRAVRSAHALNMLLSLGDPASETVRDVIMFYALRGRVDFLRAVCGVWKVPRSVLGMTIFELRYSERFELSVLPSEDRSFSYCELHLAHDSPYAGEVLRSKRRQARTFLESYRSSLDGFSLSPPIPAAVVENSGV